MTPLGKGSDGHLVTGRTAVGVKVTGAWRRLLQGTGDFTGEMAEIAAKTLQAAKGVLEEAKESGDAAVRRVADRLMSVEAHLGRVIEQSRQVNSGKAHIPDRLVSIFDPHARPIQRGKLDRPTEFGYKVCLTESEERVVAEYQVFKGNPPDSALLVDAVQGHCQRVDRAPTRTATDRGLWSPTHPNAPSGVFFFITT